MRISRVAILSISGMSTATLVRSHLSKMVPTLKPNIYTLSQKNGQKYKPMDIEDTIQYLHRKGYQRVIITPPFLMYSFYDTGVDYVVYSEEDLDPIIKEIKGISHLKQE